MKTMSASNRPLSPHLQIYKLPLTGLISITHRITGVALAMGLLFFAYSFFAITAGTDAYLNLQNLLNHPLGQISLWLFIYALFFHLCHGIRHLIWDVGLSFDKAQMNKNAIIELAASVILTLFAAFFL
jgi:succinate dehydrogenase / fumarate reductase, cytochrome b subunit